jgi:tRNA (uracil-5-)-methyltransferase TRM9
MNTKMVEILCKINNDFYQAHCTSFSATRDRPWPGWEKCLAQIRKACPDDRHNLKVFDLACGNLRFEAFLAEALPEINLIFHAVDNCAGIVPQTPFVHYQNLDIMNELQDKWCINGELEAPVCDVSVSFGFMHHVPLQEYRKELLSSLIRQTRPGGYVIASFWQFLNNDALADKARSTHERALQDLSLQGLDDNDYLLGWKSIPGAYRYCHSFSEADIDQLVASVSDEATLVSRFLSDGRTDNLNTYLVLEVR